MYAARMCGARMYAVLENVETVGGMFTPQVDFANRAGNLLGTSPAVHSTIELGSAVKTSVGEDKPMSSDLNRHEQNVERRGAQRFGAHLPLAVHFEGRTVPGFTQDLSGRGIFFYSEAALPQGAVVELTFTMPSEITLAEAMPVRCRGRVLRACKSQAGGAGVGSTERTGIAVRFDSYEYLPSNEPVMQFVRVSAASATGTSSGSAAR